MDEYIRREDIIRQLCLTTGCSYYGEVVRTIIGFPAADVQPVERWISVNDRLPDANYDCFVWYSCDTAFGKCKSWGIAHCSRCDWDTKHLDGDNIEVLYWMPLPEPPKDGDAE